MRIAGFPEPDACPICGLHDEVSNGHGYSKAYVCTGPVIVPATEFIYGRMKRAPDLRGS